MAVQMGSQNEALNKFFTDLKTAAPEHRESVANDLKEYVTAFSREVEGVPCIQLNQEISRRISELVHSSDNTEKTLGIIAIDKLLDVETEDTASKIGRFAHYLRLGAPNGDLELMSLIARCKGKLAIPGGGGAFTADFVEFEMSRALEGLTDRIDFKKYMAVILIKQLGVNASTLVYSYVPNILELIWTPLRDPKPPIREASGGALDECLRLIQQRDAPQKIQWYTRLYDEALRGFKISSPEYIHASLLCVTALLKRTRTFMERRYSQLCEIVFQLKDHKDPLIRRAVATVMPSLATFDPHAFQPLLKKSIIHLMVACRKERDPSVAFVSIGQIAQAMRIWMKEYLDKIIGLVKESLHNVSRIKQRNNSESPLQKSIFECISLLAEAVGKALTRHMHELLELMFRGQLTRELHKVLIDLSKHIPPLLPTIQESLIRSISLVLCGHEYITPGAPSKHDHASSLSALRESTGAETKDIIVALQILGDFDFHGYSLNEFVREQVVLYLEDDHPEVRKAAAVTCCRLLANDPVRHQTSGHSITTVNEVLDKLLSVGIADPDSDIRETVLSSLDERFDQNLAQADNIRSLFMALNDETFANRELSIRILGRLSRHNPAYVNPNLRKKLIRLLTEIQYTTANRSKEECARLLSHLFNSASGLIRPYVDTILKVLLPKARDSSPGVSSSVLTSIGSLTQVSGEDLVPYLDDLVPLILETLQDQSSITKREAALGAFAQLAASTGNVIEPYFKYPNLLDTLIAIIKADQSKTIKRETIKLIGSLGALDPYRHKLGSGHNTSSIVETMPPPAASSDTQVDSSAIMSIGPSSEDYNPTIAINALVAVLKDPSLSRHHRTVVDAIHQIVGALQLKIIPFLPQIMPPYLSMMRSCPPTYLEVYYGRLAEIVKVIKQHVRNYLQEIFDLVQEHAKPATNLQIKIIELLEAMANALDGEFKIYVLNLLPHLLRILDTDKSEDRNPTCKVLHALVVFGTGIEDYLHLVIPSIVKIIEASEAVVPTRIVAIRTIGSLCKDVNFAYHISRIIHPLVRALSSPSPDLRMAIMDTLCSIVLQLGSDYAIFIPMVNKEQTRYRVQHETYESLVDHLLKNEPFPADLTVDREGRGGDDRTDNPATDGAGTKKLGVNQHHLKKAWDTSQRSTKDDWNEWIRHLSVELLKESPSPPLRACAQLASGYYPLTRELFNAAFVSCWTELYDQFQDELVRALETALTSATIPTEILQILLNLAEFMEHDDKSLPIDIRTLGAYATKCHAYAKALHYKELEFISESSDTAIEALISINNQLQQPDAAIGILTHAQKNLAVTLRESWYEKLQRWDDALEAYERRQRHNPHDVRIQLGRMRCLYNLGDWDSLSYATQETWNMATPEQQTEIAPYGAAAAWGLHQWDHMGKYLSAMPRDTIDQPFFGGILHLHHNRFTEAQSCIDMARDLADTELSALVGESYNRAYGIVVRVQMLCEMEEIIMYKQSKELPFKQAQIRKTWMTRLMGCQRNVEVWQKILKVRALVLTAQEDVDMWIKFSNLCRKAGRFNVARKTLETLLGMDPEQHDHHALFQARPQVVYSYLKFAWSTGHQEKAFRLLSSFTRKLADNIGMSSPNEEILPDSAHVDNEVKSHAKLLARCYFKLGEWQMALQNKWTDENVGEILRAYLLATHFDKMWYKAWHAWALANFEVISHYEKEVDHLPSRVLIGHIVPSVQGFFRSIALSRGNSLQDALRLLTLCFKFGDHEDVTIAISDGFNHVPIDTWLQVIPQLIARIHTPSHQIRRLTHQLLSDVGKEHPQALIYPLTVASKSPNEERKAAASAMMEKMRVHSALLVDQALLVSQELIRVAILWHEMWHEGLEEASRLYFGDKNVQGMLNTLEPLHTMLDRGPDTLREISFNQAFGRDLREALDWCRKYNKTHDRDDLNQAWDLYFQVFRRINKQLPQLTTLELQYVSPKLLNATNLELAVPGSYKSGEAVTKIASFSPILTVITSKQRPRRLTIAGSDGKDYQYLLKGHEDLRQDERVMQFFGLVNNLLAQDSETFKRHLKIQRYPSIPLYPNSGLLGWVPHTDTLHSLIRDYRESRKILLNIEHRLMSQMAHDILDYLTLAQKVEVFEYALQNTTGQDLYKVLWLKSKNSEAWLDRRTNYTRSLAVMSMVGYVLGLGDRHPSNLMLDRFSGKVVHIDFGDCFEVAMHREKFPEKIPFRLTRMLTNAMEVSGIEGSFRTTCEHVMRVLRDNKENLMAVLEAFVYDPLINWRLMPTTTGTQKTKEREKNKYMGAKRAEDTGENWNKSDSNSRALHVVERVKSKLEGKDFNPEKVLTVEKQVDKLIIQATSVENLCQCYIGWCAFW